MARIFLKKAGRKPSFFASIGLMATILAVVALLLAGPISGYLLPSLGTAESAYALRVKLVYLTQILLITGALFTAGGILHGRLSNRFRTSWRGFLAVVLGAIIVSPAWMLRDAVQHYPTIHDVTTNLAQPLIFQKIPERAYNSQVPQDTKGSRFAQSYQIEHQTAYPHLKTTKVATSKQALLDAALSAAEKLGWDIVYNSPEEGRLEATTTQKWLQQRVAIVISVRGDAAHAELDIRSVSELDLGDFGVNATMIETFLGQLNAELG